LLKLKPLIGSSLRDLFGLQLQIKVLGSRKLLKISQTRMCAVVSGQRRLESLDGKRVSVFPSSRRRIKPIKNQSKE
jgi:hypothetical protein